MCLQNQFDQQHEQMTTHDYGAEACIQCVFTVDSMFVQSVIAHLNCGAINLRN